MARRRFNTFSFTFQGAENAERANRINQLLDSGQRVFGDDGPDLPGKMFEIEECIEPSCHGILVLTKDGSRVRIYAIDATPLAQQQPDPFTPVRAEDFNGTQHEVVLSSNGNQFSDLPLH